MTHKNLTVDMGGVTISDEQVLLVNKVLKSGRLTYGPVTQEFERLWAKMHEVKYALFCNSGTSALQVAIHALKEKYKWQDGDEVIIPALTFVATMNIVLHNNLKPVFVDVHDKTFNIDPLKIEAAITKKTRAIVPVHLLGQPADMIAIMKIAKKYKLKVVEDSCETVGATLHGKYVGSFGDIGCFSTYASHLVVTGVGGFCTTNDADLAIRIRGLYNHGRDGIYNSIDDDDKDSIKMISSRFRFVHSGYSYRCTELEGALGIGHIKRFSKELSKRRDIVKRYTNALQRLFDSGVLIKPEVIEGATHSHMLYPIVLRSKKDRDDMMLHLEKNGVMTRYMMPLLNQPIVRSLFGNMDKKYPVSARLNDQAMLIGCHQELSDEQVTHVIRTIYSFFHI